MIIKRIEAASIAKVFGVGYAAMGLLFGLFLSGFSLLKSSTASNSSIAGALFGIGAIVFLPVFYGILGFLSGYVGALVYNWTAGRFGGIKVEVEQ